MRRLLVTFSAYVWFVTVCLLSMFMGCDSSSTIQLVPVFPDGETDPTKDTELETIEVDLFPLDRTLSAPKTEKIRRGEAMALKGLTPGLWNARLRGFSKDKKQELLFGKTGAFRVDDGVNQIVKFFFAKPYRFHNTKLTPTKVADLLAGLVDHSSVSFEIHDKTWILVTGGRNGFDDSPTDLALLIDPGNFTIERLGNIPTPRAGHHSLVVKIGDAVRIVLYGGKASNSIEVHDPHTRAFSSMTICEDFESTEGAVPVYGADDTTQTGLILIPANPKSCIVDPFGVEAPSLVDTPYAPSDLSVSATNAKHQIVATYKTQAVENQVFSVSSGDIGCYAEGDAETWSGLGFEGQGITSLSEDNFLIVGSQKWSMVKARSCRMESIFNGQLKTDTPIGDYALANIGSINSSNDKKIAALLIGGRSIDDQIPRKDVTLFAVHNDPSTPLWHYFEDVELNSPRAGHNVVKVDDDYFWVIGGGESRPEIFINPIEDVEADQLIGFYTPPKRKRRPMLTSMSVLDVSSFAENSSQSSYLNSDFSSLFPAFIYKFPLAYQFLSLRFLYSSSDRPFDSDFLQCSDSSGAEMTGQQHCRCNSITSTLDDIIEPSAKKDPITGEITRDEVLVAADDMGEYTKTHNNNCSWRQLLRVGMEGLNFPSAEDDGKSYRGVKLMAIVTSGDDCSTNIYDWEPGAQNVIPGNCEDEAYDSYFDIKDKIRQMHEDMVWCPEDLIIAVVGNLGDDTCDFSMGAFTQELKPARRLLETLNQFETDPGVTIIEIDLCETEVSDGDIPLPSSIAFALAKRDQGSLSHAIRERNFWQFCVGATILSEEQQALKQMVNIVGSSNFLDLPLPLSRSQEQRDLAISVSDLISKRCNVYERTQSESEVGPQITNIRQSLHQDDEWYVRPNTDLSSCEGNEDDYNNDWRIVLKNGNVEEELIDVAIICSK